MSVPRVVVCLLFAFSSVFAQYNPEPTGALRLTWDIAKWGPQIERAKRESGVMEDEYYSGYPLSQDKEVRRKQMSLRYAALENEEHLLRVLRISRDSSHRAAAATAVGYTRHSPKQVEALVRATSDPDATVRENAVRALRALAVGHSKIRDKIPAGILDR